MSGPMGRAEPELSGCSERASSGGDPSNQSSQAPPQRAQQSTAAVPSTVRVFIISPQPGQRAACPR